VNGVVNAGGRGIETPFGTIYATNITPDVETGIGAWSYPAFERAMREGIHRDGRHLYPAFPYTHFARTSDADLQALYAYLMAQPAVRAETPETRLAFPFNLRPLMAGWNALFHQPRAFRPDAGKSATWNRGAYLVEGLGHCGACHSPRNALGAEKAGAYLAGGFAEGWEAPPLTSLSQAPIPWSEDELFAYLRTGESRLHGVAAGPMAPVVKELAALPDQDIRAMAVYLASFNEAPIGQPAQAARAAQLEKATLARVASASPLGARLYEGACAVCHAVGGAPLFGSRPSLADFAWFGQLSELATDPTPMRIMRREAPFTDHWVRRLDDASGVDGAWYPREQALSGMSEALLGIAGELYLPFLAANAQAFADGVERLEINVWGLSYALSPFKYQVKCLGLLR
ncbi:MAG: c-type cytochrome, partial [Bradyrhizobium sp.]|nr:c-type cytochrome [Bradyrhizobium sp.]